MTIAEARNYFVDSAKSLQRMCNGERNPWVFLCSAAFIEYLAKMIEPPSPPNQQMRDAIIYKEFFEDYMGAVRNGYRTFRYNSGERDLPTQVYHVLRCGIAHTYSLIPDTRAKARGGRDRSIVIAHRQPGLRHLSHFHSRNVQDAACFVAETFTADIHETVKLVFKNAEHNRILRRNIRARLNTNPPIVGNI